MNDQNPTTENTDLPCAEILRRVFGLADLWNDGITDERLFDLIDEAMANQYGSDPDRLAADLEGWR